MKKALIVDDTKNIRILLSHCLKNDNFEVHCASNALEAMELISNINFDIAFIDVKMPNISGTALLEQINKEGYTFQVVMMTGFGTIKNAVTTTKLGAVAYLQKPFTSNTIEKLLGEIFEDYNPAAKQINTSNTNEAKSSILPLDSIAYEKFGECLIKNGDIEKGNLFKEFATKLANLK